VCALVFACVCVRVRMCVCVCCVRVMGRSERPTVCVCVCVRKYIHTYIYIYMYMNHDIIVYEYTGREFHRNNPPMQVRSINLPRPFETSRQSAAKIVAKLDSKDLSRFFEIKVFVGFP